LRGSAGNERGPAGAKECAEARDADADKETQQMTTRFRGLSIRDLQDLHANAPTTIIAYDEHGSPAYTSGPCFGFYKAVHTALPDLLSAVGALGAALDAAMTENERLKKENTQMRAQLSDSRTCPVCEKYLEENERYLADLDFAGPGTATAQTDCQHCGTHLEVTQWESSGRYVSSFHYSVAALGREGGEEKE
jgi:regulator of replication initiation timing